MGYEEFKNMIRKSYKKSCVILENKLDILNMEVSLARVLVKDAPGYYETLRMINETHNLNLDLSEKSNYEKVIPAFERFIDSVKQEVLATKESLSSIENNFTKGINYLPLFMISLVFSDIEGCEEIIARIFVKLIMANKALEKREIITVAGESFEKAEDYERELAKLNEAGNFEEFKKKTLEYFDYICSTTYIQNLMNDYKENKEKVIGIMDKGLDIYFAKIKIRQDKEFKRRFKVPKYILNNLIHSLRDNMANTKKSLEIIEKNLAWFKSVDFKGPDRGRFRDFLSEQGIVNLPKNADSTVILNVLLNYKVSYQRIIWEYESLISALTVTGFSKPSLGLASLSAYIGTEEKTTLLIYYLIFTGIKVNSEDDRVYSDEASEQLHCVEKKLGAYLDANCIISKDDKGEFLELYRQYVELYLSFNTFTIDPESIKRNQDVEGALEAVENYIDDFEDFVVDSIVIDKKLDKENTSTVESPKLERVINPLDEYIVNNKVVKICDLEEFKVLLANSSLPLHLEQEYMKQMINLINRKTQEENNKKMNDLLCSILDEDDILLLEQAKASGNIEAMQVVKDIEFNLELMVADEVDETLVGEIQEAIEVLRRILNPKVEVEEEKPKVIYFKDYFYSSLIKAQKANYKEAYNAINRIIEGNVGQDKMLFGDNLPVKVWFKGKKFKTFYTMIGEARIVIGGGLSDSIFNEMAILVNSREFLEFMSSLRDANLDVLLEEENNKTTKIMDELKKSKAVSR